MSRLLQYSNNHQSQRPRNIELSTRRGFRLRGTEMRYLLALAVIAFAMPTAAAEIDPAASIGQQIDGFALQDFRGREHTLSEYADSPCVVVAFLGTECPLAKLYGSRLQVLADEFTAQGVTFLGIDANRQDSITELAHFARTYGVEFPLLKDTGNVVADQFAAQRTPEVFVLDQNRVIRYRGRVDDQYGLGPSTGYAKTEVRRKYLAEAIQTVLAGETMEPATTEAPGCLIGRIHEPNPDSEVTYSNQVARILQVHCVECHREGQIAPFSLTDYDEVVGWADMIEEVVRLQRMPPWHADPKYGHFLNDRSMTTEEKETIYTWVQNGAPQGDLADLPEPLSYPEGWQMGEPDAVYKMSDEPFTVPADGSIDYQYFTVDPGWEEDRWMCGSECLIDNRAVVHHIFVFALPPGSPVPDFRAAEEGRGSGEFNPGSGGIELIAGAAPGTPPWTFAEGMATHLKAGTKLIFQMHYTPNGVESTDCTSVGFKFCDPSTVKHDVKMSMTINFGFKIPAGAHNHPVEASKTFHKDTLLLTFAPHMHLRGKAFRYDLRYPDGHVETLLDVPQYDFNWQTIYMLAEPKLAPAGSQLYCLAHFDNSEDNLANPDPTSDVYWGDQTWEEMMIGWYSESEDVDPTDFDKNARTRTERFVEEAAQKPPRISGLARRAADDFLSSQEDADKFLSRVERIVPQVDRICVSVVDGDTLRILGVAQPLVLDYPLGRTERAYPAAQSAMARVATVDNHAVFDDLSTANKADLKEMSSAAGSSLHVPITLDGRSAVVSFWSKEKGAFPPVAVEVLQPLAELVPGEE